MRKIGAVVLLLAMVISLSGCGQDLKFWGSGITSSISGLNRHIKIYTWNGTVIGDYTTRSKIEWDGDHSASFFNENNKRVDIIGDMIFISEEK